MRLKDYVKDKILFLCFYCALLLLLFCFLRITGYPADYALLFAGLMTFLVLLYGGIDFYRKKVYFDQLFLQLEQLDKPYLIGEVMEKSPLLTDRLYRRALRISNRSVIETVHALEQEKQDYREYIESWIHEVKAPLTAVNLMCARKISEGGEEAAFFRKMLQETESMENAVEQALYYARSDEVYQDFLITPCCLNDIVREAVTRNRRLLTACHITLQFDLPENCRIYCDGIWLVFILSQLIRNSAQYRREERGKITISAREEEKRVILSVLDDGAGIPENELGRIFEKGFTGTNGRNRKKSTGMGLYLCRKLCRKLGLSIYAQSREGEFTQISLEIPREESLQICKAEES